MTRRRSWLAGLCFLMLVLFSLAGGWLMVLASPALPEGRLPTFLPWPIACTLRGCASTREWEAQQRMAQRFAQSVQAPGPTAEETLTTVLRRHLLAHAFAASPVTAADARRYREEILHLKDESKLREAVGISLEDYDQLVVIPFLQQAALQQERKTETVDELYGALARERLVLVLPFHFRWDKSLGRVVAR